MQDKGTSIPPSTERFSSDPFSSSSTNQAHESYLSLSSRITGQEPLRETSSGLLVGLGVEEWMEDEEGEEEEEEEMGDWTGLDGMDGRVI